jgi:hypothetical protein
VRQVDHVGVVAGEGDPGQQREAPAAGAQRRRRQLLHLAGGEALGEHDVEAREQVGDGGDLPLVAHDRRFEGLYLRLGKHVRQGMREAMGLADAEDGDSHRSGRVPLIRPASLVDLCPGS